MRRHLFPAFLIAVPLLAAALWAVTRAPSTTAPAELSRSDTGVRSASIVPQTRAPIPFFPWPPPPASTRMTLPENAFDRAGMPTLKQAAETIETALRGAGFGDWGYFSLPEEEGGFGLVTRIEQINDDGKPLAGAARWMVRPFAAATMTPLQSLTSIRRPTGHYRVFVFVLSAKPTVDNPTERATMPLAYEWNRRGQPSLGREIGASKMTERHAMTVRVYEFEQSDKIASLFNTSSQLTAVEHLKAAGIVLPGAK
jgi:hypothetical protein